MSPRCLLFPCLCGILGLACRTPLQEGLRIARPDPRAEDPTESTALGSRELLELTDFVVGGIEQRLGPPPTGRAWRVWVDTVENDTSLDVRGALVADRVVALASQKASQVTLLVAQGEEFARAMQQQQERGERTGEGPAPGLLLPDYRLAGALREHALNSSRALSRFVQFTFTLTDLSGAVVWSDVYDIKKTEMRHVAYQ